MPLIPISFSSISCCRRCLRCLKRERTRKWCSFCSAVSCWRLLLRCSRWIWSWRSRSRGVSLENLPGRGFGATCCACVSFAWEIVRDSPMVNSVSRALVIGGEVYVAWKRKMLHDVTGGHQAYIQRKIYLWSLEFRSWLRPRAVSRIRARFARDKIIKSPRSEWLAIFIQGSR